MNASVGRSGGGVRAGDYREPIDPYDYTHRCDRRASYVPKEIKKVTPAWSKFSDQTSRKFGVKAGPDGVPQAGSTRNFNRRKFEEPRPDMQSLLT